MSILKTGTGATLVRVGVSAALALSALVAVATTSQAAPSAITSSVVIGPPGGGNTITLTIPAPTVAANNKFTTGTVSTIPVGVQFQYNATPAAVSSTCSTNPATNTAVTGSAGVVTAATVRYLSSTKVSVVVPDLSAGAANTFMICVYNYNGNSGTINASATVLAKGSYTTSTPPGVPSILPASGPALGGQLVTISSSGLPTTIAAATPLTATLGGVPLTNITPINASSFTAVTPAHVASTAQPVVVTTAGGSRSGGTYAFKNGIVISPDTVVAGASVDLDIQGVGFVSNLAFDATSNGVDSPALAFGQVGTNSAKAHVYLVQGPGNLYDASVLDATHNKANGQVGECTTVAVISDTELICTVDAGASITGTLGAYDYDAAAPLADGTYTVTIVDKGGYGTGLTGAHIEAPTYQTVVSSGATFTVAPF